MVCTHPDLLARICKHVERKKIGLICFPRICFPPLIYCDQEPLLLLNVTEDYFLGVHIRLYQLDRGTQRKFSENICSEDDLRSRIFGAFFVKFFACLPLLGVWNI